MLLGRSNLVIFGLIGVLSFIYVALKRPDIAKNIVNAIGKVVVIFFTVVWKLFEGIFQVVSRMSVKAIVISLVVLTVAFLIFMSLKGAHCDCWPRDGEVYSPKSGEACLDPDLPDEPPKMCSYKYKSFTECGIDEGNIARCGD